MTSPGLAADAMDRASGGETGKREGSSPPERRDPCAAICEAATDRPFVVAQLGQSLDGRIATSTGESRWISQAPALDHLHRLRAAVDAVVVGVGTVVTDDPQLNVRRVPGRHPARVIIDPSGRLPAEARCLTDDGARRLVLRDCPAPAPAGVEVLRICRAGSWLDPHAIIAALYERGFKRLLIEGGARTISAFIDAGAVDRLHVLVSPVIIGSGKCGLDLAPISTMNEALRPPTEVYLLGNGDVLFDCDLRNARKNSHVEQS